MGWTVIYFHGKRDKDGTFIPDPEKAKLGMKAHICHPRLTKAVLRDLEENHAGKATPTSIEIQRDTCIDLGGMVCTDDKLVEVVLSYGRVVEFWPHHVGGILDSLEARLRDPSGPKWRGKPGQRWTKIHLPYFCFCLTPTDVKYLVRRLREEEPKVDNMIGFYRKLREKIGPNSHVLLPGEPGHPIENLPVEQRN
jgi:hypothetical protein